MNFDSNIVELIPVNQHYHIEQDKTMIHFARLRELHHAGKKVDHILFLSFSEDDQNFINQLKGSLQLLDYEQTSTMYIDPSYPLILSEISRIRTKLESLYKNHQLFLNCTPFNHHFHAFLIRDGLNSSQYELTCYEIFNPRSKNFENVVIPQTPQLTLDDWMLLRICLESKQKRMTLKDYIALTEGEMGSKKKVRYLDQKLRNRLNQLVDKGLMANDIGQYGEKIYYLKYFKIGI